MARFLSDASTFAVGTATVCVLTGAYLLRRLVAGQPCRSMAMLEGKTVIVTGANTGVGKATALDLARRKARVIMACRDQERGEQAVADVAKRSRSNDVHFRQLDLASFASIRQFSEEIFASEKKIDVLVNNAGVFMLPLRRSEDGFEMQLAVNCLGPFFLTNLLLPRLKVSTSARIVNVAGKFPPSFPWINFEDINSERSYYRVRAMGQSKVCLMLWSRHLAKQLEGTSVSVNSLHPGLVRNEFGRFLDYWFGYFYILFYPVLYVVLKTPKQGAQTSIYCAVSEELEGLSGKHFYNCKIKDNALSPTLDEAAAQRLWDICEKMTGLK